MALRDNPYLPLYVQDFLTDEKLIMCSASATGVYIRIMCIMHKSESYGKICYNKTANKQLTADDFARILERFLPYSYKEIITGIEELLANKVLTIEGNCLCQKRMIRDMETSLKRGESGKKGMESRYSVHREKGKNTTVKEKKNRYNKNLTNTLTNTENESENEYENENLNIQEKEGMGKKPKIQNRQTWKIIAQRAKKQANLKNHRRNLPKPKFWTS